MTTATTGATSSTPAVGTPHTRVEGRDKVTGAARYAGEVTFDGLAHGWLVLSTVPSSKFHRYCAILKPGTAYEALPSKVTASPTHTKAGVGSLMLATAVGCSHGVVHW